jgi:uncharacterized protein
VIRLDIGSLPEGHSHQDIEEAASEIDLAIEGGRPASPVRISLDIIRSGDEILVAGRASVSVAFECARCLENFTSTVESPFNLVVIVGGEASGSGDEESLVRAPAGAKSVDLAGEVRSELLVRLPLKPLCREDCRGLCPECGTNLNAARCACKGEDSDSRWDALKRFKTDG